MRRRDALLEGLELFRDLHPAITLGNMIAFLYVCENEGLTILDLAQVSGLLPRHGLTNDPGLFRAGRRGRHVAVARSGRLTQTAHGKAIHLTEAGRRFREQLERVIAGPSPITGALMSARLIALP